MTSARSAKVAASVISSAGSAHSCRLPAAQWRSLAILRVSNTSSASRRATPPSIFVAPFSSGSSAATPTERSVDSPSSFRSKAPAVVTVPVALRSAWPLTGRTDKQSKAREVPHRRREGAVELAVRRRPSEACAGAVQSNLHVLDRNRLAGHPRSVSAQPRPMGQSHRAGQRRPEQGPPRRPAA